MSKFINYRSTRIIETEDLLLQLNQQAQLPFFTLSKSDALRTYSDINRSTLYEVIQKSERLICDQLVIEGLMDSNSPFPRLSNALLKMLDFRSESGYSGVSILIHYEERGCVQDDQFLNSLSLVSHGKKWGFSMHFGGGSKIFVAPDGVFQDSRILFFNEKLALSYIKRIQDETGLLCERPQDEHLLNLSGGALGQDFPVSQDPVGLVDNLKKVYSLFSGERLIKAAWRHGIMDEEYAEQHAIEHLNKIAERKIEADRYKIEMRCRFTTWEALEQIRLLCTPNEPQLHRLGEWKLKGRDVLKLVVSTTAKGHQFIVQSKKPLHPTSELLPSQVREAVLALGVDLTKPISPSVLLNKKSG